MFFIIILFALETSATIRENDVHRPPWLDYFSHERSSRATHPVTHWWESYTETTAKAWWNNFTTESTEPTTASTVLVKFLVPEGNFTLAPNDAMELFMDPQKLNETISEQTQKLFGEDKPELHELVTMWLFMLVNRTKVERNSTFVTREFTYEMRTTTSPTTTTRRRPETTWHTTELVWTGPVGGTEDMVTDATDMDTGSTDLDTGPKDLGIEQTELGTTSNDLNTGPEDLGMSLGPGQADLGTGKNNLDTGPSYMDNMAMATGYGVTTYSDVDDTSAVIDGRTTKPTPKSHKKYIIVKTTTTSTTVAPTEVTTHMALGRQLPEYSDLLERPDYDAMASYIAGKPDTVDEAATSVLMGIVSPSTTTENPLIVSMKKDMADSKNGFFSTFAKKMLEIIATMETEQAGYLFAATDFINSDMEREGSLRFLGIPLEPALLRITSILARMPPEIAQSHMTEAYTALSDRSLVHNGILDILDSLYNMKEGEDLFASLVDMEGYPENNITSRKVMRRVIDVVLQPFIRLKGTDRLNSILYKLNNAIGDRYPDRRNYERAQRAGHIPRFGTRTKQNQWTAKTSIDKTKRKDVTHKAATNRYRNKNTLVTGKLENKEIGGASKIDERDLMKKIKRLKIQGISVETDRDFTLDKIKHKTLHSKRNVKRIIEDHLKNKHPDLYENYRRKYKKAKEQTNKDNKAMFGEVFKRQFLLNNKSEQFDKDIIRKKETLKRKVSEKKPRKTQTRFHVIDTRTIVDDQNGGKPHIKDRNKSETAKINKTEISKYLSKYKLKTRPHKRIDEIKREKMEEDSLSSDEKDLKSNLEDAIRHGDRKFDERRNKIKIRNVINEVSSYSDEEGVLKNNIYKVFGYTQRSNK